MGGRIDRPARPARRDGAKIDEAWTRSAPPAKPSAGNTLACTAAAVTANLRVLTAARQVPWSLARRHRPTQGFDRECSPVVARSASPRHHRSATPALRRLRTLPQHSTSIAQPSGPSAAPPVEPSRWRPRPPNTKPNSSSSSGHLSGPARPARCRHDHGSPVPHLLVTRWPDPLEAASPLAGAAPIPPAAARDSPPAQPPGDRQLNRALHTVA